MQKNRSLIVMGVMLLFLISAMITLYTNRVYEGTHKLFGNHAEFFLLWSYVIIFSGLGKLFRKDHFKYKKLVLSFIVVIAMSIPLILVISKPQYRYDEGADMIKTKYPEYLGFEVVVLDDMYRTVPTKRDSNDFEGQLIIKYNDFYDYVLSDADEEVYFMMDSYSGRIVQMSEKYWSTQE